MIKYWLKMHSNCAPNLAYFYKHLHQDNFEGKNCLNLIISIFWKIAFDNVLLY